MPANLDMYVGPAGVWGDVNDILQSGLHVMKASDVLSLGKVAILDRLVCLAKVLIQMTGITPPQCYMF